MSERKIHYYKCNRYVGIIRDAKLMKNLHYVCDPCVEKEKDSNDFGFLNDVKANTSFQNMMDSLFGKK